MSEFAMRAFHYASEKHNQRLINFGDSSGFKERINKKDKVDMPFVQTEKQREVVRNFAFSYRLSMAEVFRISMEAYLDQIDAKIGKLGVVKHIYRTQVTIIKATQAIIFPAFHIFFPINYHLHPD